jgi:hypothetical protein
MANIDIGPTRILEKSCFSLGQSAWWAYDSGCSELTVSPMAKAAAVQVKELVAQRFAHSPFSAYRLFVDIRQLTFIGKRTVVQQERTMS